MIDAETPRPGPEPLVMTDLDADPHRIADVRGVLSRWLSDGAVEPDRVPDVVLAVYEAMANVVEHAYTSTSHRGVFDLRAEHSRDTGRVEIVVRDHGSWQSSEPGPLRGRGLPLIETLSDDVTVTSAASGTEVIMRWDRGDAVGARGAQRSRDLVD
ncbi:ATP-binding protein [Rhodococcoides corynebacterioides]|uniref:ATP-binding protein n=1 Tax=Rhodococcoides corynebacterioides TaxID=53972 RepID=UPI001C9A75E0|nr:ATP-binding protein [Rhodococcus corynebacterioides]MBY6363007.1 ATP-binding protein [Rhodococcus corynebacterioides]